MVPKEKDEGDGSVPSTEESLTEVKISNFAAKLGEETGGNYTVYIYRKKKDEETGNSKRPFIKKYVGIEPDPAEIAEKYRGGTYYIQFIWHEKKAQRSKGFTLDVDEDAFPPLPKQAGNALSSPYIGAPGLSEQVQLQLAFFHEIAEVMKSAYSANNAHAGQVQDPLAAFSGLMDTMEDSYSRAMAVQSKIMERVLTRNMEKMFQLGPEGGAPDTGAEEDAGLVGKYAPVVKEVVDGLKYIFSMFGAVPPKVVENVKKDERFKEVLKDPKALIVIGKALRQEFGDAKAAEIMKSFGVQMVFKKAGTVVKTPDFAGVPSNGGARSPVPAGSPQTTGPGVGNGFKEARRKQNRGKEDGIEIKVASTC